MKRRVISATVSVALVLGLAALASPAESAGYRPRAGGVFNQPRSTYLNQTRIERTILEAINHARAGSNIHIALYSFDRLNMAEALIKAKRRGVRVQILINGHQTTRAMNRLRRVLGADRRRNNFIHVCKRSCRSSSGKLHSKFYLFSRTGAARDVTMVGSANLTTNAIANQWNDMMVLVDRPAVRATFLKVFEEMRRDAGERARFKIFPIGDNNELRVMPFWGATADRDPVIDILDKVRCYGAAPGTGTKDGRTIIRVSQHAWDGRRGVYLARKVRSLYAAGCDVRLLYGMAGGGVKQELRAQTRRGKVPVRADGWDTDGDSLLDKYSHQKYLLISGRLLKKSVERVYTGSSNWSDPGVRGDEIIFMGQSGRLFQQWNSNFSLIWSTYSRPDGSSKLDLEVERRRTLAGADSSGDEPMPGGPAWEGD